MCRKIQNTFKIEMSDVLVFLLIVSIFACNAFCMIPSSFKPPSPENVEFDECFFVPEIIGGYLSTILYGYRHICPQKLPDDETQSPQHDRNWFIVGKFRGVAVQLTNEVQAFDYVPIRQSLVQFLYMNESIVKIALRSMDTEYIIKFQCLQQSQTFYGLIYHSVELIPTVEYKIGVMHEIMIEENTNTTSFQKMGMNLDVQREKIDYLWYITIKNELGDPLLIFSQSEASMMRITRMHFYKRQLLLRISMTYYILTFPDGVEAKHFSDDLAKFVVALYISRVEDNVKDSFQNNTITMNS